MGLSWMDHLTVSAVFVEIHSDQQICVDNATTISYI